ncbi:uncharacterized protein LOC120332711 isoform X1 [Styela clava]
MVEAGPTLLKVECSDYEVELNCSDRLLESGVQTTCCEEYSEVTKHASPHVSLRAWYKCCDSLVDNGLAPSKTPDWENSSYQAYIMGVAVFGILICLFVSGARSVRRRRTLMRLQQRQEDLLFSAQAAEAGALGNQGPDFCTQVSLGPPTYGELESKGLTKDYKLGAFDPPPYPGIGEESLQYVPSSREPSESEAAPPLENESDKNSENSIQRPEPNDVTENHQELSHNLDGRHGEQGQRP